MVFVGYPQEERVEEDALAGGSSEVPLSIGQRALWFLDRLAPGSSAYILAGALRVTGPLHVPALRQVLEILAERHPALRTSFGEDDGAVNEPVQRVLAQRSPTFVEENATAWDEATLEARQAALAWSPFDLERDPLLRVGVLHRGPGEHRIVFALHHIVSDFWSLGVLLRELSALYRDGGEIGRASLRPLRSTYAEHVARQAARLAGADGERLWEFWRRELLGSRRVLDLSTDRPRPKLRTFRGDSRSGRLDGESTDRLRALARERRTTVFATLLAAFQGLLYRYTGEGESLVGSPTAGRSSAAVAGLIGYFVNPVVLRGNLSGDPEFTEVLEQARRTVLAALEHRAFPFPWLAERLAPERDPSLPPIFQVMLAFEQERGRGEQGLAALAVGEAGVPVDLGGLAAETVHLPSGGAQVDLALYAAVVEGRLVVRFQFNPDLFDGTTTARMVGHFLGLLAEVGVDPAGRLSERSLLTAPERQQLLEWNATAAGSAGLWGSEVGLQERIATVAAERPDVVAVVFEDAVLSYGELVSRARRMARGLAELDVLPGDLVAIWMRRGLGVVPALLGIHLAGAGYVPLEPEWPVERCHHILASLRISCLVTDAAYLRAAQELQWRLPSLRHALCPDIATPRPPIEPLDRGAVRALFDVVAVRAVDRISAAGFVSSYTGQAFANAEVDEYAARVLGLARPHLHDGSRVLEIGCGSGLLTFALAGEVARYVALDPSPATQERNRARNLEQASAGPGGLPGLELEIGFAHEIERYEPGSFDFILIASTVQFFPGLVYLERVIELALGLLSPGGVLLLADLLDLRRRADFRASLEEFRGRHRDDPSVRTKTQLGSELYVDEDFFADVAVELPALADIQILHRESGFDNELRFRYDVVLRKTACGEIRAARRERRKPVWTGGWLDRLPAGRLPAILGEEALAYVIFTSGSTGVPKGVAVQHRPVRNLIDWVNRTCGIGPADRVLFVTSLCFDLSVYDVFGLLAAGGSIQVVAEDEVRDPRALAHLLLTRPITFWDSAPAALQQLVPFFPAPDANAGPASLRQVFLSGDWIPVGLPDAVRRGFPGTRVMSLGGATEATVWSNFFPVSAVDPDWKSIPYGRPIQNARYYVLDAQGRLCPIGIAGDLYIGDVGLSCLASHYAEDPAQTADRFLPDPLGSEAGGRIYRTGDRSRYLADGNLEFLGRSDSQVKIRGYRIEQGEIETALALHPEIEQTAVLVREDASGDRRLVAYFVPVGEPAPGAADLRSFLRERLPEYMVPAAFVALAAMPVTVNGKVDRQALPAPEWQGAGEEYLAPRTPIEATLAALWVEILDLDRVGVHEDFFQLGGHSLKASQLVTRIREAFGVELPLRTVFASPTVAGLAGVIARDADDHREAAAPVKIPQIDRSAGRFPLSFSQEQLWFLDRLQPGVAAYNLPAAMRLEGRLVVPALAAGLSEVLRRHEALRTRFELHAGAPVQVIAPPAPFWLPMVDLSGLAAFPRGVELARLAVAEAGRPFDLAHGPLVRASLLRQGTEEHVLLLTLHHIGADARSLGLFVRELAAFYAAASSGQPAALAPIAVQFVDFAVWQRQHLQGERLERLLAFWRERLEGWMDPLELPADRARPPIPSHRGARLPFVLPADLALRMTALGRRAGATPFMALFAAFAVLLHRLSDRERLTLGSPVASRGERELEGMIGLLLNTLVFPFDFTGAISFLTVLERTRDLALDAFAHQDLPFPVLVEALEPERDLSRNPLFQVFFALQSEGAPALKLAGLVDEPMDFDPGTAQFDLALHLNESRAGTSGWFAYNTDLFEAATVGRWGGHFLELLGGLASTPERRISEQPLLTAGERALLTTWRQAGPSGDPVELGKTLLHERIEAQVDLTPEGEAVLFTDIALSYTELDRRANRLAHRLRRAGAGPGRRVALCVRRSAEMVVALLAVLKSGAAYVPLDPEYPAERVAFMLADAGPVAVVVESATSAILAPHPLPVVRLDDPTLAAEPAARLAVPTTADDLAYVIYTSGSTGRPKGVMISHRNLGSFFSGIDRRFGPPPVEVETWLAVTSISFDISVLELLWPLTRGARVVVQGGREEIAEISPGPRPGSAVSSRPLAFSLFYFADAADAADAANTAKANSGDKYRLLLEGARFADEHGFEAVWTPERHFHSFGGLYPNPSITSAAVAAVTRRVAIRAGSLVLPLHDPIRVAEDWSMVDNLSGGRVGISFASGWHGDDFVFAPHQYADRREVLYRDIETVRDLWRGGTVTRPGGEGVPVDVRIRPRPVQPELPVWITAAGNPDTFRQAGAAGAHLLTHLLGQTLEELGEKIAVYRRARRESGHAGAGRVTLMLHTFVGENLDEVRAVVAGPFRRYLQSSVGLLAGHARSLGRSESLDSLSVEDVEALLDHAFERYFRLGALVGTPESCLEMVERLKGMDVDEVACLIDFGVPADLTLSALPALADLRRRANPADVLEEAPPRAAEPSLAALIRSHGVSWLQATPSMARMLVCDSESFSALRGLKRLLLGGEALPEDLALSLRQALPEVELHNMYGPTETTVWSTAERVDAVFGTIPIGRPLSGEWAVVLDRHLQPRPVGIPGELYLGGGGVARGYHARPALTAERFVPDPFADRPGGRLYRTGDLVRRRPDGGLEFLGRVDQQVKVRGHRIEPGEIEVLLRKHPGVAEALVVARPDAAGDASLAAYLVPRRGEGGGHALTPVPAAAELLSEHHEYQLPNGLTVAHLSDYQTAEAYREIFRSHDYLRHGIRLEDGACIFDVGANIGLFSLFANQVCRRPRIYAFEPMPVTFDVLRTNVALYGLDVSVFNHGIADRPARTEFTFYPNAPGMSGRFASSAEDHRIQRAIVHGWLQENGAAASAASTALTPSDTELDSLLVDWFRAETVVCPVRTLSEVLAETGVERIDLLKIDAESSEVDVLLGLAATDWPKIRQVVAEVHSPALLAAMISLLAPRGFEIATEDVSLVEKGEDGQPIHVVMLYAVLTQDGGIARPGTPRPSAAFSASSPSLATPALRAWLRERLPEFMIPSVFVPLDALPLTPNGKIDRKALPAVDGRRPELEAAYVPPSSEVEERLAGIWQEVLGLDRVGMHDNFFELGGTSLSLVQVRSALQAAFGTSTISLVDMFRHPTVASLAARVAQSGEARVALDEVEDRGRQQADALRTGTSAVDRRRGFLEERRQRRGAKR